MDILFWNNYKYIIQLKNNLNLKIFSQRASNFARTGSGHDCLPLHHDPYNVNFNFEAFIWSKENWKISCSFEKWFAPKYNNIGKTTHRICTKITYCVEDYKRSLHKKNYRNRYSRFWNITRDICKMVLFDTNTTLVASFWQNHT